MPRLDQAPTRSPWPQHAGPRLFRWLFFHGPLPYRVVRRLAPLLVGRRPVVREVASFRMLLTPSDVLQTRLLLDGVWEPAFTRWWAFLAAGSASVLDIGAHCGFYTLMARAAAPAAAVHAFEPNPALRADWVANMRLNGVGPGVRLDPRAVAAGAGPVALHVRDIEPATASVHEPAEYDRELRVDAVSVDDYRAEHGLDRVDLVKLDIEGSEAPALDGMLAGLAAHRYGALMIETHRLLMGTAANERMRRLLLDDGYALYRIGPDRALPLPPDAPIPDYDQWLALDPTRDREVDPYRRDGVLWLPAEYAAIWAGVRWAPA